MIELGESRAGGVDGEEHIVWGTFTGWHQGEELGRRGFIEFSAGEAGLIDTVSELSAKILKLFRCGSTKRKGGGGGGKRMAGKGGDGGNDLGFPGGDGSSFQGLIDGGGFFGGLVGAASSEGVQGHKEK